MQLYSQHEFSGEAGVVTLAAGAVNLTSYYTGSDASIYVILILSSEEDADVYEEGLAEISRQVLMNLDESALKHILPSLFQRLSVYPTLNEEQRYAMLLNSEIKRMVLKRLRDEVAVPKSEFVIWLKDIYKEGFVDLENIMASMAKMGIIKVSSVKGMSSDMVFLVEDIMAIRKPPAELISNPTDHHLPEGLKVGYLNEVKTFFSTYKPDEKDTLDIIDQVILNPQCYEVLKLLREAMVTRNDLEKLRKKGVDDIDTVLKTLWNSKLIAVFQDDKGTEYHCLTSDVVIKKYFPRYLLDKARQQYINKVQNPGVIVKSLELLKEEYYAMIKAQKEATKDTSKAPSKVIASD
jgi:hypothetical protein